MSQKKESRGQKLLRMYLAGERITAAKFAEKIGISTQSVYSLTGRYVVPTLRMAKKIQDETQGMVPAFSWLESIEDETPRKGCELLKESDVETDGGRGWPVVTYPLHPFNAEESKNLKE